MLLQIRQKPATAANQLQQAASRGVVVLVHLHVLGELGDPLTEKGDLDLGRSGVLPITAETADNLRLLLTGKRHDLPPPCLGYETPLPQSGASKRSPIRGAVGRHSSTANSRFQIAFRRRVNRERTSR